MTPPIEPKPSLPTPFRMAIAGAAVLAGLALPFVHRVLDWHAWGFWGFCVVVVLAATYRETRGLAGDIVAGITAWRKR